MTSAFAIDDIFEIAEQIEKNGIDFYNNAAENTADLRYKKFLKDLAAMEVEHEKTFASMRSSLTGPGNPDLNQTDESAMYLKSLADLKIFHKKHIETGSLETILMAAIEAEKDSIVFYVGMKDLVPERLGRNKIEDIINEEKKHVRLLVDEYIALKKK